MEFRLLGAFEVCDQGLLVEITGSKRRALLALLVLRANEVVRSGQRPLKGTTTKRDPLLASPAHTVAVVPGQQLGKQACERARAEARQTAGSASG